MTITTDELKLLFEDLNKNCDPELLNFDVHDVEKVCIKHPCVQIVHTEGQIELIDGSLVIIVDEGDGSMYDWFWTPVIR